MQADRSPRETSDHHQTERLSHGLYGLIIVTATLGAERVHVDNAGDASILLLSTAFVLLLAHTYSAVMAERATEGGRLGKAHRRLVVADNLPVVAAVVAPLTLFGLVGLGLLELETAYRAAIASSLAALFGIGLYQARLISMGWFHSIVSGLAAGSIGVIVVVIEAFFD
jgi:hypothetical protein